MIPLASFARIFLNSLGNFTSLRHDKQNLKRKQMQNKVVMTHRGGGQQKEALRVSPQPQASSGKPESEPPKGQVVSKCVLPDIPLHRTAQQPTPTWRLPARCTSEQKPAC